MRAPDKRSQRDLKKKKKKKTDPKKKVRLSNQDGKNRLIEVHHSTSALVRRKNGPQAGSEKCRRVIDQVEGR